MSQQRKQNQNVDVSACINVCVCICVIFVFATTASWKELEITRLSLCCCCCCTMFILFLKNTLNWTGVGAYLQGHLPYTVLPYYLYCLFSLSFFASSKNGCIFGLNFIWTEPPRYWARERVWEKEIERNRFETVCWCECVLVRLWVWNFTCESG